MNEDGTPRHQVKQMCACLDVSGSGFYEWCSRPASLTAQRRERLAAMITHVTRAGPLVQDVVGQRGRHQARC